MIKCPYSAMAKNLEKLSEKKFLSNYGKNVADYSQPN